MPGRDFASPADFSNQFGDWLTLGNARIVRTLKARPIDLLAGDRAGMLGLPPVPLHLGWRNSIRLPRDYYVRLDASDYDVHADLHRVRVRAHGRPIAGPGQNRVVIKDLLHLGRDRGTLVEQPSQRRSL